MNKKEYVRLTDTITKQILQHKEVLAYILKASIKAYENLDIETIAKYYIKGSDDSNKTIDSKNVEVIIDEKKIILDMFIEAIVPDKGTNLIDIEMQRNFYNIEIHITRANVYNDALVLHQLKTFKGSQRYRNLKPVYSIWLFTNAPKKYQGTITEFFQNYKIVHGTDWLRDRDLKSLDMQKTVFIFLSENDKIESRELEVLSAIFNEKMNEKNRNRIFHQNKIPNYIKKEVNQKMNVGRSMWEEAERFGKRLGKKEGKLEGKIEGKLEGKIETVIQLIQRGISLEEVTKLLDLDDSLIIMVKEQLKKEHLKEKIDSMK